MEMENKETSNNQKFKADLITDILIVSALIAAIYLCFQWWYVVDNIGGWMWDNQPRDNFPSLILCIFAVAIYMLGVVFSVVTIVSSLITFAFTRSLRVAVYGAGTCIILVGKCIGNEFDKVKL